MTLYLEEGDYVIAEEPVVPDNASIFRNKGINLVTVPMEPDGMDLAKLETAIRKCRTEIHLYHAKLSQSYGHCDVPGETEKAAGAGGKVLYSHHRRGLPAGFSIRRKPRLPACTLRIGTGR